MPKKMDPKVQERRVQQMLAPDTTAPAAGHRGTENSSERTQGSRSRCRNEPPDATARTGHGQGTQFTNGLSADQPYRHRQNSQRNEDPNQGRVRTDLCERRCIALGFDRHACRKRLLPGTVDFGWRQLRVGLDQPAIGRGRNVQPMSSRFGDTSYLARFTGATRRAYELDVRVFLDRCAGRHLDAFHGDPANDQAVVRWMQEVRGYAPATVARRLSTVCGFSDRCDGGSGPSPPRPAASPWRDFADRPTRSRSAASWPHFFRMAAATRSLLMGVNNAEIQLQDTRPIVCAWTAAIAERTRLLCPMLYSARQSIAPSQAMAFTVSYNRLSD